ncbi:MAG: acyltransferase [Erysipelotrichaceae bacterium]|nr:acyltransferase [Erysipelotrichaceae bacterium]
MKNLDRNYGLDLLRIVSMIMVVTHHFLGHGGVLENVADFSFNWYIVWMVRSICYTSVTMFYLISFYFQNKKNIGLEQIVKIWIEVITYSVLSFGISIILGWEDFTVQSTIKAFFPVLFRQYGFFNSYLLMCILAPFLNKCLENLDKKYLLKFIGVLIILVCILPYVSHVDAFNMNYGEGILWLLLLYLIARFLSEYTLKGVQSRKYIVYGLGLCIIQFLIKLGIALITKIIFGSVMLSNAFMGETPLISLLASIMIFLGFKEYNQQVKIKNIVKFSTPLIFAVYLIHENNFLKYHIWEKIYPGYYANQAFYKLFLYWVIVIISMFAIAFILESTRRKIEQSLKLSRKISNVLFSNKIMGKYKNFEDIVINEFKN